MNPFTLLLPRAHRRCLAFFLACLLGASTLSAVEFTYAVVNGEATITGTSEAVQGELTIPSELGGYPVTAIGYEAFYRCSGLTAVTIPAGVKRIDGMAFASCDNLASVSLPEGLEQIGGYAFYLDFALTSVDFPESVTVFGEHVFDGTKQLPVDEQGVRYEGPNKRVLIRAPNTVSGEFTVPDSVRIIHTEAFRDCPELTSLSLPDHLIAVGCDALTNCSLLPTDVQGNQYESDERKMLIRFWANGQHFDIPETVRYVHSKAFNSSLVRSVTLHERVTVLGAEAFSSSSISSITLPAGITQISSGLFYDCYNLQEVTLLGNIKTIGNQAFYGCRNLSAITLPETVTTIGYQAFTNSGLQVVTLPASVEKIDFAAFDSDNLALLEFQGLPPLAEEGAFRTSGLQGVYQPAYKEAWEAVIEEGTWMNLAMTRYKAPEELQWPISISGGKLTILSVPEDFVGTRLVIPADIDGLPVTAIGARAFAGHDLLTSLFLPASITTLHADAFLGAAELSIEVDPANAHYASHAGFLFNKDLTRLIAAPSARGETCVLPESVQEIAPYAFRGCTNLLNLTLPSGLTTLPEGLFYGCSNLRLIVIPANVTKIESEVFTGCDYLHEFWFQGPPPEEVPVDGLGLSDMEGHYLDAYAQAWEEVVDAEHAWKGIWMRYVSDGFLTGQVADDHIIITDLPRTYAGALEIPATLGGLPVTIIRDYAFDWCQALTSVSLPEGVTEIGDNAFMFCTALKRITLPASLTAIGNNTFRGCTALKRITLPASLTAIGYNTFRGCSALTEIEFPANLSTIGFGAFTDSAVTRFIFNGPPPTVDDEAFPAGATGVLSMDHILAWGAVLGSGNTWMGLTMVHPSELQTFTYTVVNGEAMVTGLSGEIEAELVIPEELGGYPVTAIGANAFSMMYGNTLITSVVLPKSVKRIGMAAFGGCNNLASVSLPEGLVDIGAQAFANCYALTSVNFPSTLKTLGASAFLGCAMTTVALPEGLTAIGDNAFRECSALTSVDFPASVTEFGDNLFYNCTQLPVDEQGVRYEGPNKRVLIGTTIEAPVSGELVVPASVRAIQPNAFYWNSALTSVTLPEGLTTIGTNAFCECSGLTSVSLPDTLTAIGADAFAGCNALPTDEQGNQYESAERKMLIRFQANSQHFDLPETVRYVHPKAFNGSSVQSVTLHERVTVLGAEAFSGTSISSITLPAGITQIAPGLFCGCSSLQAVTLQGNITTIGDHAFYGCNNLSAITLPESVTTIEGWAFYGCGLRSITLPASVTAIGYEAFAYCDACILTFQRLPPEANDKAFYSGQQGVYQPAYTSAWEAVIEEDGTWKGLPISCYKAPEELQWPTSVANGEVTILGVPADLVGSELIIPATLNGLPVTAIGASAFAGHDLLTSLSLPASITTLHADAFLGAAELSIEVAPANAHYASHAGFLFNKELTRLIAAPSARGEVGVLPESVQEIAPYAFRGCANLLSLTLPSGLTTLPEGLFYGCSNLKSLVIPAGVTTIESAVFTGCYLYTLEFLGPPPTEVALNEYGDLLASQAEGIYHAEHAAAWQAAADEMGIWHGVNFCYIKSALLTGYVRYDGLEITDLPRTYAGALEVPATLGGLPVVAIGIEAFSGCQALTSVKLPESVTEMGSNAFKDCTALESITLPTGVTVIDYGLFWGCTALTDIELPASVRTIGGSAFAGSAVSQIVFNGPPPDVYDNAFPAGATGVYQPAYASAWAAVIEEGTWKGLTMVRGGDAGELPSIPGDPNAEVVQAANGTITIRPSEGVTEVVVAIPDGVNAASVTVEVSTEVKSVTANGAQLKVIKIEGTTRHDITPYLTLPDPVSGKVNLLAAEVLPAIAKEALDLSAGATFDPAASTPIVTANTKPGLTYTLLEGATLNALSPTKSILGNGKPWKPEVSQTGSSAFYRIRVSVR